MKCYSLCSMKVCLGYVKLFFLTFCVSFNPLNMHHPAYLCFEVTKSLIGLDTYFNVLYFAYVTVEIPIMGNWKIPLVEIPVRISTSGDNDP